MGGVGGLDKKSEGMKKYKLEVTSGPGDVQYSLGIKVSSIVITMYGVRRVLELSGRNFVKYVIV